MPGAPATDQATAPVTPPASRRPWLTPAVVGAGALAACAVVAVRDPNRSGSYGFCPFQAVTGLDCPGCGMTRAAHALFNGDVVSMLDHNVFFPVVAVVAVVAYVRWARRSVGRWVRPLPTPPWAVVGLAGVLVAFWVLRNLGGPFEFLAATASTS